MASSDQSSFVSPGMSEALLAAIERATLDPQAGIFGPHSMIWKISRESALFLGAGRAAIMQLAHPWVATAIEQHSRVMSQPIARFHNTFRIVFAMIFGSLEQALAAARYLYALHTRIRGEMTEDVAAYPRGSHYEANEIAALRWVFATLVESAVLGYEFIMPPLTVEERETYYAEWKLLAALFGLPPESLPCDWAAFLAYCRETEQSNVLGVSGAAREMGQNILAGAGSWIKPPRWYRALTTKWLPERFRVEFRLTLDQAEDDAIARARNWLPGAYHHLPEALRCVGPWHEARHRLRRQPLGALVRWNNQFWIGQPRLPFAGGAAN